MSQKLNVQVVPITEVSHSDPTIHTQKHKPVILIVDDERVIADTLSVILRQSGFQTLTAYNGKNALDLVDITPPDLLLSDVVMPGMTGVELAIELTQRNPKCRVLLFSGQAATVDLLEKARSDGYNFTTLAKPVHPTDMLRRISECLKAQATVSDAHPEFAVSGMSDQYVL
jgi:DNA-binding NtrC family response regulator